MCIAQFVDDNVKLKIMNVIYFHDHSHNAQYIFIFKLIGRLEALRVITPARDQS